MRCRVRRRRPAHRPLSAAAARSAGRRVGRRAVVPAECLRPRRGAAARSEARRGAGQPAGGREHRPARDRRGAGHGGARAASAALRNQDAKSAVQALLSVPGQQASSEIQRLLGVAYWTLEDYAARRRSPARRHPPEPAQRTRADRLERRAGGGARSCRRARGAAPDHRRVSVLGPGPVAARPAQPGWRRRAAVRSRPTRPRRAWRRLPAPRWSTAAIGRLQHNKLDLAAAARTYERRVALTPLARDARLDLGGVYRSQDRLDDALAEFLIAALIDPKSARAFAAIGQVHADNRRRSEGAGDAAAGGRARRHAARRPLRRQPGAAAARARARRRARSWRSSSGCSARRWRPSAAGSRTTPRAIEEALRAAPKGDGR